MTAVGNSGQAAPPIPVTIVGGYLGAGKTTLINALLAGGHGLRLAVLVNDFGAVNIDAGLIARHDGETVALTNGCICCSIAGDLGTALRSMAAAEPRPDRIVVEASGVADPGRTANYAHGWPELRPDRVVVLADSETVQRRAADRFVGDTVLRQLAAADLVVQTKTDLVSEAQRQTVRDWLLTQARDARILQGAMGQIPPDLLADSPHSAPRAKAPSADVVRPEDGHAAVHAAFTWTTDGAVDRAAFMTLLRELAPDILRAKGWLRFRDCPHEMATVQVVGERVSITPQPGAADGKAGTLAFVLRDDAAARRVLQARLAQLVSPATASTTA